MYRVIEKGLGKLVCNCDGCTPLTDSLSQTKLKRLFTLNCEFIEYVETKTIKREETEKPTEVPATEESATDKGTSTKRRKRNSGKGTKKH